MKNERDTKQALPKVEGKKPYKPPMLRKAGNVRDLTMGVTPGTGDSLGPGILRP